MSFTENDRNVQSKSGKSFPAAGPHPRLRFVQVIAVALREEFGRGPSGVKTAARLTEANERAVRNWFEAKNGPSGENLISLLQHSDIILKAVLDLAGRRKIRAVIGINELRPHLAAIIAFIDRPDG